ncbi:MAG: hypothetical protein Q7T85_02385, partial [Nitrosomonas sp.]|nr:hypothetical protein [Nitrosomonas sp.]
MNAQPANSSAESQQIAATDERPWPGLASFLERDAPYFKGRDDDIRNLYSQVNRERLTVLFGVSGLGKSSLLQAGLFPQLREDNFFPVLIRLDFSPDPVNLSEQVFAAIARQARDNAIEAPQRQSDETLWEYFHHDGTEFWNTRNRIVIPLLCFDQFEEIFTLGRENSERIDALDRLLQELADLIEGRCPDNIKTRFEADPEETKHFNFTRHPYKLIFSLREDYLAELEGLRALLPSIIHNRFRLLPMNGEQAMAVVDQTQGRLMTSSTAENIVRLAGGKQSEPQLELSAISIEPALLSLFCHELNERRIDAGARQIDTESAANNREQILQNFYERSLADHAPELRQFIEDKLITISGFRNSEAYDNALGIPGVTAEALDQLVQCRLMRLEERDGHKRIELIHDVLTGVVRKSREQRQLREIQQAEREFLAARQREKEVLSSRRRAWFFAILSMIGLIATIVSFWSMQQAYEEKNNAQSALAAAEFLEAQQSYGNNNVSRALVHLAQAIRLNQSWISSRTLLINLLQQKNWYLPELIFKHKDTVLSIAFSLDGPRMVITSVDNTVCVWNVQTGKALGGAIQHEDAVLSAAFSADGTRVVTTSRDKTARVWDAQTGKA